MMKTDLLHYKKLLFALLILLILSIVSATIIFTQINKSHADHGKQYNQMMLQEAISHFEDILVTRKWNAKHGGVYVKQQDGLTPNPYLKDNILQVDHNNTYIKINPAWMTRQLSELGNTSSSRYYKITSLKPLNPDNKADEFETEGLKYLRDNPDKKYYYKNRTQYIDQQLTISESSNMMFDFIGRLDVDTSCLKCHASQGYKLGDLRGGIRISLPIQKYQTSISMENELHLFSRYLVIAFIILLSLFILVSIYLFYTVRSRLTHFNLLLERSVNEKTKALQEINRHLEEKITEGILKNKEKDQLIIAQSRHAAMGEMIAMIAHQWRQPLSSISLDASTMSLDIEMDEIDKALFKEYAQGILEQTDYLSETIDDFRNFFRREREKSSILPSQIVGECLKIMKDSLTANNITYSLDLKSEIEVEIYSRDLLQIFINLVNNAKDSLIDSECSNKHILFQIDISNNNEMMISICDNGPGIDPAILPRIFEPYFSTKENKNGTGLGLYMCKMIIEQHFNGSITVDSHEEQTCFKVLFPM